MLRETLACVRDLAPLIPLDEGDWVESIAGTMRAAERLLAAPAPASPDAAGLRAALDTLADLIAATFEPDEVTTVPNDFSTLVPNPKWRQFPTREAAEQALGALSAALAATPSGPEGEAR